MDSYENIQVLWGVLGAQQPYSDEHKDRQRRTEEQREVLQGAIGPLIELLY